MASFEARLTEAFDLYRRGDLNRAEQLGRELVAERPRDPALCGMLGMIAVQRGQFADAAPHLRLALAETPDNIPLRIHLAFALANAGEFDEARRAASGTGIPQLERIVAYVDQQQGRAGDAIAGYRRVLASFPTDAESWKNLGLLLTEHGDLGDAIDAFERSLALRDQPETVSQLARALAKGERHVERQALLRDAASRHPDEPSLLVDLGLAEAAMRNFDAAEQAYLAAITRTPGLTRAYLEYGVMLEALNRLDDLESLIAEARGAGVGGPEIDFIEALRAKRTGRFADALALAEGASDGINPSRRAQLIGEAADRLGDSGRAFAAFTEMNRLSAVGPAADYARSRDFPGEIERTVAMLTPETVASWPELKVPIDREAPAFLLGFPRSGTTLLDTLLMNVPGAEVLEEEPLINAIEDEIGGHNGIASLSQAQADALRAGYWRGFDDLRPNHGPDSLVIDKFPFHLVRAAIIQRIFPDARFIMAMRHPCDTVLSCFMTRFQINRAMVHFDTLESTARLYDLAMQAWERAKTLLELEVHNVRYEGLVSNPEGEMRPLLQFLGRPWNPAILDHQASAERRAHIATPSYSQILEPLYLRAAGRWTRYRREMEPVLPLLAPWAERMGYEI